jgi:hypothetical protein
MRPGSPSINSEPGLSHRTPFEAAPMTQPHPYHKVSAEALMTPAAVDSLGFEDLGYIGPPPPDAPLSYYVEYGPEPREPERRLFIASSVSLPQAPKPPQPPKLSKPRKPSIRTLVKQAEQATGKAVTAVTMPDGTRLELAGAPDPATESNPWRADLQVTKQ